MLNAEHKLRPLFNGQAETTLTSCGESQAVEAGRFLARNTLFRITRAVSSPIQRSIRTAKIALSHVPNPPALELSDAFKERSLGIFERRYQDEVFAEFPQYRDHEDFKRFRLHFSQKAPGGENLTEVTARAWAGLEEFEAQSEGDLVIFSHGVTIRCIVGKALRLTEDEIVRMNIPNAAPIVLTKESKEYEIHDRGLVGL